MTNETDATGGILTRKYKPGSIIYFENDKSEYIYILKSGRIVLTSLKLDNGEEVKEEVRQGEFFGVKSALGKYPREETAQTVGETVVLVLALPDFERLVLRNVNVVRKMLRVFSNQLRRIGKMVRSVLGEGDNINPDRELFRIGEYYFKTGVFQQAQYAFKKLMEYYPDSEYANPAMEKIKAIDSGQTMIEPSSMDSSNSMDMDSGFDDMPDFNDSASDDFELNDDLGGDDDFGLNDDSGGDDDFGLNDGLGGDDFGVSDQDANSTLSNEMDDFLSTDDSAGEMDDFSFDEFDSESSDEAVSMTASKFNEAIDFYNNGLYDEAIGIFKEIASTEDVSVDDRKFFEDAHFELGRCYKEKGGKKEALGYFSKVLKQFPNSDKMKNSLYCIGEIFESINQKDKARTYFSKVASMPPTDDISQQASDKLSQL